MGCGRFEAAKEESSGEGRAEIPQKAERGEGKKNRTTTTTTKTRFKLQETQTQPSIHPGGCPPVRVRRWEAAAARHFLPQRSKRKHHRHKKTVACKRQLLLHLSSTPPARQAVEGLSGRRSCRDCTAGRAPAAGRKFPGCARASALPWLSLWWMGRVEFSPSPAVSPAQQVAVCLIPAEDPAAQAIISSQQAAPRRKFSLCSLERQGRGDCHSAALEKQRDEPAASLRSGTRRVSRSGCGCGTRGRQR